MLYLDMEDGIKDKKTQINVSFFAYKFYDKESIVSPFLTVIVRLL